MGRNRFRDSTAETDQGTHPRPTRHRWRRRQKRRAVPVISAEKAIPVSRSRGCQDHHPIVRGPARLERRFLDDLERTYGAKPERRILSDCRDLPGLADQPPADHAFQGKVFLRIDGGSFSGAADLAALIHHLKRGTFIGEETGGGYYGNSSGKLLTVTLPNSGLKLQLPLYGYLTVTKENGTEHGVGRFLFFCGPVALRCKLCPRSVL